MCLLSVAAFAQTETDTTKTYLEEVVISVNRWEQNQREVSTRVAKITPSLIQLQNPQTSADLLGLSNQVFIQKSQLGGGSPMIRGFATNRILLVVDGVRMNNAIFRSGNLQNVISIDASSIQNTEVVFGPGSVVYGSDAIGGVMNFTTLTPVTSTEGTTFSANAFARYASANEEKTGHVDFSIGLKKWAFVTSITKSDFSDLKMGSKGPTEYTRPEYQVRDENGDDLAGSRAQLPSSTARTRFRNTCSPSPRTTASIQGASFSTCGYMKVPWMPPSTVTTFGSRSLASFSRPSAL